MHVRTGLAARSSRPISRRRSCSSPCTRAFPPRTPRFTPAEEIRRADPDHTAARLTDPAEAGKLPCSSPPY
jgi:hypothetical protein